MELKLFRVIRLAGHLILLRLMARPDTLRTPLALILQLCYTH